MSEPTRAPALGSAPIADRRPGTAPRPSATIGDSDAGPLPADLLRGPDGRRHGRLPGAGLRPVRAAGHPVRQRHPPGRHVHPGQHGAEQHVHPAGRWRAEHRPGAADRPRGEEGRRSGRGLHQPDHDARADGPVRDHPGAHPGRAGHRRALLRRRLEGPERRRAVPVDGRPGLLLHAAGVLLRRLRAGGAGAELPGPVRPDDVGADRQQRGLHRRPAAVPGHLRPDRHQRRLHARARRRCSASAPPSA